MVGGGKAAEAMMLSGRSESVDQCATWLLHANTHPPHQPITVIRGSFPVAERFNAQFTGC